MSHDEKLSDKFWGISSQVTLIRLHLGSYNSELCKVIIKRKLIFLSKFIYLLTFLPFIDQIM